MKNSIEQKFDILIRAIEKIAIPIPAIPAIPAINPILPIPAIAPIVPTGDHELLQRLDVKVDSLKDDIKALSDGTSAKISDHETRLRVVESSVTKIITWGSALILFIGILEFLVSRFIK